MRRGLTADVGARHEVFDAGFGLPVEDGPESERENRELRQANEILRKASAYFAMEELDRRSK